MSFVSGRPVRGEINCEVEYFVGIGNSEDVE